VGGCKKVITYYGESRYIIGLNFRNRLGKEGVMRKRGCGCSGGLGGAFISKGQNDSEDNKVSIQMRMEVGGSEELVGDKGRWNPEENVGGELVRET